MDVFDKEVTSEQLVTRWRTDAEDAFTRSVQDLRDQIDIVEVDDAIAQFNIPAAEEAVGVGPDMFGILELVLWNAWIGASLFTYRVFRSPSFPKITVRTGPAAAQMYEDFIRPIIQGLVQDQRAGVVATIMAGHAAGKRSREIALDLAGRVDKASGRRIGGIIGVNGQWADRLTKLDTALRTGDKAYLKQYLKWKTRDSRYDAWVRLAIDGGTLSPRQVATILLRTADRAVFNRAKNMSEELVRSVTASAQYAFIRSQVDQGKFVEADLTKVWHHMHDRQVRFTHRLLGDKEVPFGENFITARGASLAHPHDPSAPREEREGCRCWLSFKYKGKRIGRSGFRGF